MIRSLHISRRTDIHHTDAQMNLFDFVEDVYLRPIENLPYDYEVKLAALKSAQGDEIVVDNFAVVMKLLTLAGFLVHDLGKVSV